MQRINSLFVIKVTGFTALVGIYAFLWLQMITNPALRTGTDFIAFYAAGRIANEGDWQEVYDPQVQMIQEEKVLGFPIAQNDLNPFVHPPFILPMLALITNLSYPSAMIAWGLLMLVFYIVAATLLEKIFPCFSNHAILYWSVLLFFPVFVSVLNGQDTAILLLGLVLWWFGLKKKMDHLAGFGLALALIRPHIALLLAIPFVFARRKVWWWFLVGASILAIISFILIGFDGAINFLQILGISASGEGYKISESHMVNLLGMLNRVFPMIRPGVLRILGWLIYLVGGGFLCLLQARLKEVDEKSIGSSILIALLVVPHLHYHDLALLLIPIFCFMTRLDRSTLSESRMIRMLPLAISWLLVISSTFEFGKYTMPYIAIALLATILWKPGIIIGKEGK